MAKREEAFPLQEAARDLVDAVIVLGENGYNISSVAAVGGYGHNTFKFNCSLENKNLPLIFLEAESDSFTEYAATLEYCLKVYENEPLKQFEDKFLKSLCDTYNSAASLDRGKGFSIELMSKFLGGKIIKPYRRLIAGFNGKATDASAGRFLTGIEAALNANNVWEKDEDRIDMERVEEDSDDRIRFKQKKSSCPAEAIKKSLDLIFKQVNVFEKNGYRLDNLKLYPYLADPFRLAPSFSLGQEGSPPHNVTILINEKDYHKYKIAVDYSFKIEENLPTTHINKDFLKKVISLGKENDIKVKEHIGGDCGPDNCSDYHSFKCLHTEFDSEVPAEKVSKFYLGLSPLLKEVSKDLNHICD